MAKLFQMDAMETELRRLNAENRSLQDRTFLAKKPTENRFSHTNLVKTSETDEVYLNMMFCV